MKIGIILAIVAIVAVAGFVTVNALTQEIAEETPVKQCNSCGNSCTQQNNCGRATCGAINGGTCGCNR